MGPAFRSPAAVQFLPWVSIWGLYSRWRAFRACSAVLFRQPGERLLVRSLILVHEHPPDMFVGHELSHDQAAGRLMGAHLVLLQGRIPKAMTISQPSSSSSSWLPQAGLDSGDGIADNLHRGLLDGAHCRPGPSTREGCVGNADAFHKVQLEGLAFRFIGIVLDSKASGRDCLLTAG